MRIPLQIPVQPYLRDHRYAGTCVFPAVESMQLLAQSAMELVPGLGVRDIHDARFLRFLPVDAADETIAAFHDLEETATGWQSRLLTMQTSKSGITRAREHVTMRFGGSGDEPADPGLGKNPRFDGEPFVVGPERVYGELVPFLEKYHNIDGDLIIYRDGVRCRVKAPAYPGADGPLGSPFPLDAAFHAACAWGQRHSSIVGFPMGFYRRLVFKATKPGEAYEAVVIPRAVRERENSFDLWLYDDAGVVREAALGVLMRDASGGALSPPAWIRENG